VVMSSNIVPDRSQPVFIPFAKLDAKTLPRVICAAIAVAVSEPSSNRGFPKFVLLDSRRHHNLDIVRGDPSSRLPCDPIRFIDSHGAVTSPLVMFDNGTLAVALFDPKDLESWPPGCSQAFTAIRNDLAKLYAEEKTELEATLPSKSQPEKEHKREDGKRVESRSSSSADLPKKEDNGEKGSDSKRDSSSSRRYFCLTFRGFGFWVGL
jgi:hypothetical protein